MTLVDGDDSQSTQYIPDLSTPGNSTDENSKKKAHKNAIPFREKSFPHYETLAIVFGKDRATGNRVEHPTDVIEELDKEVSQETIEEDFIDIDSPSQDATTGNTSDVSLKRKRKRRLSGDSDSLGEIMRETNTYIGSELVKSSQLIKDGLDEVSLYEKRQRFTEQVMKMNLTIDQCFTAIGTISANRNLLDLFFIIGDNLKETWVRRYSREY
ncbi:uncharacterized protein A4U43_C04F26840 [Asparagus officinalis]|uniref:Uncharacterized protein n=1 Tax=Asparagus officinalis TaxID=4686 RepID=A0A5P1F982_ASPOF|nr:uncharacterized protein A4U43_C04F26840 [Asparagus officinalis]